MFGSSPASPLLLRRGYPGGIIDDSGATMGGPPPLNGGGMLGDHPSTIHLTDPSQYGMRPALFGGGSMARPMASPPPSPSGIAAAASPNPTAAGNGSQQGGMFAAPAKEHHSFLHNALPYIAAAIIGASGATGNPMAGEQMRGLMENMAYARKKRDADAQTQQYVQALIGRGMDPNDAIILAADPAEMAKHFGTRFDAATIDEGSTRAIPNFNGTLNTYTAPKTFQHGADVVQMPGREAVTPAFSNLSAGDAPQTLGTPVAVPGLRTDAEQYADSTGAQPGSPQWGAAMQDFTLKDHGPTAFGFNSQLQSARLGNARTIAQGHDATSAANARYNADHRAGGRAAPASRLPTPSTVIGGIMSKQAAGQPLTPAEEGALRDYRTHYKPQHGSVQISPNEPVAVGPNGERMVVRNGQWVAAH